MSILSSIRDLAKTRTPATQSIAVAVPSAIGTIATGNNGKNPFGEQRKEHGFVISTPRIDAVERMAADHRLDDADRLQQITVTKALEADNAINITLRDRAGAIVPPHNPFILLALVDSNGYLSGGNYWKSAVTVGQGYSGDPELLAHLDAGANERETFQDILDQWSMDIDIYGNTFVAVERSGITSNFYNMTALRTRVKPIDGTSFHHFIHYEYALGMLVVKEFEEFVPGIQCGVKQFKLPTRRGHPFYGDPEYISAKRSLVLNYDILTLAEKFFENSFMGDKAITFKGADYTEEDIQRFRSYLTSTAKGLDNAHKIVVFQVAPNEDVKIEDLNVEIKDAAFSGLRSDNKEEIVIANRVPPSLLGIASPGKLSNTGEIREALRAFKISYASSRQKKYEAWWQSLFKACGLPKAETFKLNPIDSLVEDADIPALAQAVSAGFMTTEDAQAQFASEKSIYGEKQALAKRRIMPEHLIEGLIAIRDELRNH